MDLTFDSLRLLIPAVASELFDLGPDHERAPELRRRLLDLMKLARAKAHAGQA